MGELCPVGALWGAVLSQDSLDRGSDFARWLNDALRLAQFAPVGPKVAELLVGALDTLERDAGPESALGRGA